MRSLKVWLVALLVPVLIGGGLLMEAGPAFAGASPTAVGWFYNGSKTTTAKFQQASGTTDNGDLEVFNVEWTDTCVSTYSDITLTMGWYALYHADVSTSGSNCLFMDMFYHIVVSGDDGVNQTLVSLAHSDYWVMNVQYYSGIDTSNPIATTALGITSTFAKSYYVATTGHTSQWAFETIGWSYAAWSDQTTQYTYPGLGHGTDVQDINYSLSGDSAGHAQLATQGSAITSEGVFFEDPVYTNPTCDTGSFLGAFYEVRSQ